MQDTVLNTKNVALKRKDKALMELTFQWGETGKCANIYLKQKQKLIRAMKKRKQSKEMKSD